MTDTTKASDYDLRVLSLGAGVQSTALYLMCLHDEFKDIPSAAIFADTQWEPPRVYRHLDRLDWLGGAKIPIHRVSAGDLRSDVLEQVGFSGDGHDGQKMPVYVDTGNGSSGGMLWRECTRHYKVEPIKTEIRRLLGIPKGARSAGKLAQQWIGISLDEAHRMKDSRVPFIQNHYPLIERRMTRSDCLRWIEAHGYPRPGKSSCIGCPYHSGGTWAHMRDHEPELFADAVDFDRRLRLGRLPGVTGQCYLHRKMMPLEQAVNATHNPDQLDLFGNDCEGMCGV